MTLTLSPSPAAIRPLVESRPPYVTWQAATQLPVPASQPPLDLLTDDLLPRETAQPVGHDVRVTTVSARWCAKPHPRLPDAARWSGSLALAVVEALHARRPIAQLNRWLDEEVLAAINLHRRRRTPGRPLPPQAVLRSVRVQHPHPEVAEVAAHLMVGRRSLALAFRLEGFGDRWMCTALELGPRPAPPAYGRARPEDPTSSGSPRHLR